MSVVDMKEIRRKKIIQQYAAFYGKSINIMHQEEDVNVASSQLHRKKNNKEGFLCLVKNN